MSQDRDAQPSILPPEEAASANPESERVFAVLAELVRLKDIKDRDGESEDYRSNKDRAWEQARQIISDRLHSY